MTELTSRKLPIAIIAVLLGILVVQYVVNVPEPDRLIDPTTCEIYSKGPDGTRTYLDEFDQKCADLKNLLP